MKRILKILFISAITFTITLILIAYVYRQYDAVDQLNHALTEIKTSVIKQETVITESHELRQFKKIELSLVETKHSAKITLSLPDSINTKLPIILIIGGLNDGRNYLELVKKHADNILVAYHYPNNNPYWEDQLQLSSLLNVRESMLSVPFQISMIMHWLNKQSYVDTDRINLMTYSLGAIFASSIIHLARKNEYAFSSVSIVYGAGDLQDLIASNLKLGIFNTSIAWLISSSIYPLDGSHHIPYLKSNFLLINGEFDEKIPLNIAKKMHLEYPEPKKIFIFPNKHMHPKRKELSQKLIDTTFNWHASIKMIN